MSRTDTGAPLSKEVIALQETFVDLLYMTVETEHARWMLRSDDFSILTIILDGLAVEWRRWSEEVAEHLIAIGVAPDGRVDTLASSRYHNPVPQGWRKPDAVLTGLLQELGMRAEWCRSRTRDAADSVPESVVLLERIADSLAAQTAALRGISDVRRPGAIASS